jgi:hypothetical protein
MVPDASPRAGGNVAAGSAAAAATCDVNTVGGAGGGVTIGRVRSGSLVAADCVMTGSAGSGARGILATTPRRTPEIEASRTAAARACI